MQFSESDRDTAHAGFLRHDLRRFIPNWQQILFQGAGENRVEKMKARRETLRASGIHKETGLFQEEAAGWKGYSLMSQALASSISTKMRSFYERLTETASKIYISPIVPLSMPEHA